MGALIAQMQGIEASAISVADYGEELDDFGPDFSQTIVMDRDEDTFRHGGVPKSSVSRRTNILDDLESEFSEALVEERKAGDTELVKKAREKKEAEFFAQLDGMAQERDTIRASVIDLTSQLEAKSKNVDHLFNEKEKMAKQLQDYQERKK